MNPGSARRKLKLENEFPLYLPQESNQTAMDADNIPWGDSIDEQEALDQDSKNINANATYSHPFNNESNSSQSFHTRPYLHTESTSERTRKHFSNELPYIPLMASAPYASTTEPASQFGACLNSQSSSQNTGNIMFSENRDVQMGSAGDVSPMQSQSTRTHNAQMHLQSLTNDSQQSFNGYQEPQRDSSQYSSDVSSTSSDSSYDDEIIWLNMGYSLKYVKELLGKRVRNFVGKRKILQELTESQSKRRKFE